MSGLLDVKGLLGIIVLLLILVIYRYNVEEFRACGGCRGGDIPPGGITRLNPFLPPFSSTPCIDDIYIINADTGVQLGTGVGPLTHLNTPDHVVLTN
jgi:hypothetical protein